MDLVADFAIVSGLGREAALDETLSWMQQVLARHAALEAARAKTSALGTLHACATGFGAKDAHHGFNAFLASMDAVIAAASPGPASDPNQPTAAEIATFERIAARANQSHV